MAQRVDCQPFEDFAAIGLMEDGHAIAGVVYTRLLIGPSGPNSVEMAIAAEGKRWAHRRTLNVFFGYAFNNLDVNRVTAFTKPDNQSAHNMLTRLGFEHEGTMRSAYPSGEDALIFGLLRRECRWC